MNNNLSRFADSKVYFQCPICTKSMDIQGNSLICRHGHCFDISRYGYVNLLLKSSPKTNYSKRSFDNRHQILEYGMYDVVLEKIIQFISDTPSIRNILDVGCGEGFYARQIQQRTERNIFAFDLSREAIQIASKKDKRKAVKWFVTDLSKIPLKDGSMDCILDIFSPAHYKEFQRLLSPNGYVVKVIPTKNHLREIRTKVQAHLKNPDYSNESVVEYFEKYLKTISRETVSATVQLSSEQRMSFIEMTPLLFCVEKDCVDWRTLTHLTIEADAHYRFAAFFSPWWINLEPSPDCHFSRCQSMPPDVKSWTTFFTNFFLRTPPRYCSKPLIFLDIPPFFTLAVYFFALIFIFIADDLGSSPFLIIKESSFNLFLCCAISLQDSISIFSKNPAYLWFFHQKQKFDPTYHQQPEKIGVKNALRFLLKKTKIFNFRASDTLFPLHHVLC